MSYISHNNTITNLLFVYDMFPYMSVVQYISTKQQMYWENNYSPFYDFASLYKIKNESILMYQCATNIYSRRIINVFVQYAPLKWLPVNGNNKQWGGFQWLYQHCVRNILGDECQYVNNQGVERSI